MKKLILKILLLSLSATAVAQTDEDAFVFTWNVEAGETITLPTDDRTSFSEDFGFPLPLYIYDFTIDWGDGMVERITQAIPIPPPPTGPPPLTPPTHTYTNAGIYTVTITETYPGGFAHIFFNNGEERLKLRSVEQWGDIRWQSMYRAFWGCENLRINATDIPNLEDVTDMGGMFLNCRQIDRIPNINSWDVSNVTNMADLFLGVGRGSGGLGWNDDISGWVVSSVTNMSTMFGEADSFNQDISGWDVSNVRNMFSMFVSNDAFNQDLSSWEVHNVTNFNSMFYNATSFDKDLGSWDLRSAAGRAINLMVQASGISCTNYSATLTGWANNPNTPAGLVLSDDPEEIKNQYGNNPSATDAVNYLMNDQTGLGWRMDNSEASDGACLLFEIDSPIDDATIDENRVYSTEFPLVSSGSPVGGISNIKYSLGGADAAAFALDEGSGVVTMDPKNFEEPEDADMDNIYEVALLATDENGNYDRKDWTVTVNNVIETVTFTINPIADVHIEEGTPYNRSAPTLSGETPIGTVTYTLAGADGALFEIVSTTGTVSMEARDFANPEDANSDNVYEGAIIATDEDGNNDSEDWTVTVDDEDELSMKNFTINAIADVSIDENTPYISPTPALSGDTPVGSVTYTLGGTDAAAFTINSSTGVVRMMARDYEDPADANADNVYEVLITATDEDDNSASEDWTVTVNDVDDTNAFFAIISIPDVQIDENTPYTSNTPSLSGTPVGLVTYTLGGADAEALTIDENSGIVFMEARDFEDPADANMDNVYEILITATDEDSNVSTASWTVTVLDVPGELPGEGISNIPTAFTPNGDGVNDTWIIDDLTSDASVVIRNRQGTILYESRNYAEKPWDGRYKGDVLPAGAYLFTIRNGTELFRGTIVILK